MNNIKDDNEITLQRPLLLVMVHVPLSAVKERGDMDTRRWVDVEDSISAN